MIRSQLIVGTCAALALMVGNARAGFTYTETLTGLTSTGTQDQNTGVAIGGNQSSFPLTAPSTQTLLSIGSYSTTPPPGTNNFSVSFLDTITINNVSSPGFVDSGNLVLQMLLSFSQLNSQTETSTLSINGVLVGTNGPSASVVLGGNKFTLSGFVYTAPTVSLSLTGSLTGIFTSTVAVPEPASMTLMGLGLAGLAGFGVRRKRLAA